MKLYKEKHVLVGNTGGSAEQRYYAFPSILRLNDGRILVAYKNGEKHMLDREAPLEALVLDARSGETLAEARTIDRTPGWIHQNPELMRMPDGSIALYVDVQRPGSVKARIGIRVYRSFDEGASFQDEGWFPQVGDFVYGYSFDDAVSPGAAGEANMLVMSFPELHGGIRAVHAIRTNDNGRSWSYVRNLNAEFAFAFNESSLVPYQDGFVVVARGDDQTTKAFRTDRQFRLQARQELSARYEAIDYIGRPELFCLDGHCYILCRNIPKGTKTGTLRLYRLNPSTLEIEGHVQLDTNASSAGDSYYAEHWVSERDGRSYFNVVTYLPKSTADKPDIVRLEFDWEQLKEAIR